MNERDKGHFRDIWNEGQQLQIALSDKTKVSLDDYLTANGVCHAIVLIGEAASQISAETRNQFPEIQWKLIIGMRNFVIHQYRRVDMDIIWHTATVSVPHLLTQIESLLKD